MGLLKTRLHFFFLEGGFFKVAVSPEVYLISAVIRSRDSVTPMANGIITEFFHGYADEWRFIERYIAQHKRTPSKGTFLSKFPDFRFKIVDDPSHWCEEVRKAHLQTSMMQSAHDLVEMLDSGKIDDALKFMHQSSLGLQGQMSGMSDDQDVVDHWQTTYDEVIRRVKRSKDFGQSGVPTGFPTLDERTGGPQSGHLWLVAGRLGHGKTVSMIKMATAACFSGFSVLYDSLEQSRAEITMRFHSFASSELGEELFKSLDLAQGQNFSPREYKQFLHGLRGKIKGKFHVADTSSGPISPLTIGAQIEKHKPDIIFVDYLGLLDTGAKRLEDTGLGVARTSASLKRMAQQYQIPIVVAAQLNRKATERRDMPEAENISDSDGPGRDADGVITLRQISPSVVVMKLAKFRHGPSGFTWYNHFNPNTGQFVEVSRNDALDLQQQDIQDADDAEANVPLTKNSLGPRPVKTNGHVVTSKHVGNTRVVLRRK